MKTSDLLLTKEQINFNVYAYPEGTPIGEQILLAFTSTANSASLKTAKFYESGISGIINNAKSSEDAIFKIGGFIYEAGRIIKKIEDGNITKEHK